MNRDIRIATTAPSHPKVKRLKVLLRGVVPDVFGTLVELWCYTALHAPSTGIYETADDLEMAVDWAGSPGQLADALRTTKLADALPDGRIAVHDWLDWNEWAAGAPKRSEDAKRNAHKVFCPGPGACDKEYCPNLRSANLEPPAEPAAEPAAEQFAQSGSADSEPKESETLSSLSLSSPSRLVSLSLPNPENEIKKEKAGRVVSSHQAAIGRILEIFPDDRSDITPALAGDWLKTHGGDVDHLIALLTPHVRRPLGYICKVANDLENRKSAKGDSRQRRSQGQAKSTHDFSEFEDGTAKLDLTA